MKAAGVDSVRSIVAPEVFHEDGKDFGQDFWRKSCNRDKSVQVTIHFANFGHQPMHALFVVLFQVRQFLLILGIVSRDSMKPVRL